MEISSHQQQSKPQPTSHSMGGKLGQCASASSDRETLNFTHSLLKSASAGDTVKEVTLSWLYLPQERAQAQAQV